MILLTNIWLIFFPLGAQFLLHQGKYRYIEKTTHVFLMSSLTFVYEGQLMQEHVVLSSSLLFAKNYSVQRRAR